MKMENDRESSILEVNNSEENISSGEALDQAEMELLPNKYNEPQLDSPNNHMDSGMSSLHESSMQSNKHFFNESEIDDESQENSNISSMSGDEDEIVISAPTSPVSKSESEENEGQSKEALNIDCKNEEKETGAKKAADDESVKEKRLPDTVTVLNTEHGGKVYVIGTAHFSKESQSDVVETIRMVRPDVLVLELCKSRFSVLQLSEEKVLEESDIMNFAKMRSIIREQGKMQGILYMLLLSSTAHITKELGMAPGGEFRTAYQEVSNLPNCKVILGDRPIDITLSRALASLSLWKKIRLMVHILRSKEPISKEDVEKCKRKDFIEELLKDMTDQFPEIHEVFVKERDIFLSNTLQNAAYIRSCFPFNNQQKSRHPVVVGVVGIGHISGIVDNWKKVRREDIERIMIIPPTTMAANIGMFTLKYSFYGCLAFATYKCLPRAVKSYLFCAVNSFSGKMLLRFSK